MIVPPRMLKNDWTLWHGVAAAAVAVAAVAVTLEGWRQIVELGLSRPVAGHVFLVPVVAFWLVWVRRKRVLICRPSSPWIGFVIAWIGAMAFVYGEKRVHPWMGAMPYYVGTVLLPLGCVVAILGRQLLLAYLPPFVVLLALVPPPIAWAENLARPLQLATGAVTAAVYEMLGSSAVLEQGHLRIDDRSVRLAEVTAGLPMAMSLMLVSYGFVFGTPLRASARLVILLLTPLTAVLCSALALIVTFWLYADLPVEWAALWIKIGEWIMLLVAFSLLVGAVKFLTWASVPVRHYTLAYDR